MEQDEEKEFLHDAAITFQIESDYEERPTEKEFLTGLLKLLKHLTANPGQIFSPEKRTFLNTDKPMSEEEIQEMDESTTFSSLTLIGDNAKIAAAFRKEASEKGFDKQTIELFLAEKFKK